MDLQRTTSKKPPDPSYARRFPNAGSLRAFRKKRHIAWKITVHVTVNNVVWMPMLFVTCAACIYSHACVRMAHNIAAARMSDWVGIIWHCAIQEVYVPSEDRRRPFYTGL